MSFVFGIYLCSSQLMVHLHDKAGNDVTLPAHTLGLYGLAPAPGVPMHPDNCNRGLISLAVFAFARNHVSSSLCCSFRSSRSRVAVERGWKLGEEDRDRGVSRYREDPLGSCASSDRFYGLSGKKVGHGKWIGRGSVLSPKRNVTTEVNEPK